MRPAAPGGARRRARGVARARSVAPSALTLRARARSLSLSAAANGERRERLRDTRNAQAVAWVVGFVQQNFLSTFYGWLVGVCISVVLCVPDWPLFNRHPVSWLSEVPPSGKKDGRDGGAGAKAAAGAGGAGAAGAALDEKKAAKAKAGGKGKSKKS